MTWLDEELHKRINNPQWQKNMALKIKQAIKKERRKKNLQLILTSSVFLTLLLILSMFFNPKDKPTIGEIYETWLYDEPIDEIFDKYYPVNYFSGR